MKKIVIFAGALVLLLVLYFTTAKRYYLVENFNDCVEAGNPVMESFPRQCMTPDGKTYVEELPETCAGMSLSEAKEIAAANECGDDFKEEYFCNDHTMTWWIDLNLKKEGCNPACVIDTQTKTAEINWRCTGLLP